MLFLQLAKSGFDKDVLRAFPWLPAEEEALNTVNPMELAEGEPSLITAVVEAAREKNYIDWAGGRGLTLLAALPDATGG